jgi:branched-chain amino acid transport system ATP-binding protein
MDEPSEGFAPVMVQHLEEIILGLKREGLSILLVEQHLYSTLAVADRGYVLETGQVVHHANVGELAQHTESCSSISACTEVQGRSACASD